MASDQRRTVRFLLVLCVSFMSFSQVNAQNTNTPSIGVSVSDGGSNAFGVQIDKQINNPDGSVSAEITLVSKTYLTYGFRIFVEQGTAESVEADGTFNIFRKTQRTIPFFGKWTYHLGRVILSPDARISIFLDNIGLVQDDTTFLLSWDYVTAFLLFTGFDAIPQDVDAGQHILDISETFAGLLGNLYINTAVLIERANQGAPNGIKGALETLGSAVAKNPAPFVQFLQEQFNIAVSPTAIASFGKYFSRFFQVAGVIHLLSEFNSLPRHVTQTFSVQTSVSTPSVPSTSFGDLTATLVSPTHLTVGQGAVVFVADGTQLTVMNEPSTSGATLGTVDIGTLVVIADGPKSADGFNWWQIVTPSGLNGWVVSSFNGIQTLFRVDIVQTSTVQATPQPINIPTNLEAITPESTQALKEIATLYLNDYIGGSSPMPPLGNTFPVDSLSFSPGGDLLAVGTDGNVVILNLTNGTSVDLPDSLDSGTCCSLFKARFSPKGHYVAVFNQLKGGAFKLFSTDTWKEMMSIPGDPMQDLLFSSDENTAWSISYNTLTRWNLSTQQGTQLYVASSSDVRINALALSPDGTRIVLGLKTVGIVDGSDLVIDASTGKVIQSLGDKMNGADKVLFSPNGILLATSGYHTEILIWTNANAEINDKPTVLNQEWGNVYGFAFSPDGKLLATSMGLDETMRLWNTASWNLLASIPISDEATDAFTFNPSGTLLASGSRGGHVKIWAVVRQDTRGE